MKKKTILLLTYLFALLERKVKQFCDLVELVELRWWLVILTNVADQRLLSILIKDKNEKKNPHLPRQCNVFSANR